MGSLGFDGLQRYRTIAEIGSRLGGASNLEVLDIGGGTGGLGQILSCRKYRTIDPVGGGPNHVRGTMAALPFTDKSYDLVIQADSLEHVPSEIRGQALQEMVRVSRDLLIWIGPVEFEFAAQVEEDLRQTHRRLFNGREMDWLNEHRRFGLPSEEDVLQILGGQCRDWRSWKSCSLKRWWVMGRLDLELDAGAYNPAFAKAINEWYSTSGWKDDYRVVSGPAYRLVFVGKKEQPLPDQLDEPLSEAVSFHDWESLVPVMKSLTTTSSLSPEGQATDTQTLRQLERIAEILVPERNDPSLLERIFGGKG